MRVSAIFLTGLAAVALAAPVEVSTGLAERQYSPNALRRAVAEDTDVEKRQYRPIYKVHGPLEGKETEETE
ncbi:hypothetical protein F4819DRAFT_418012 [Hypoxylon fuscum]|nr:hypothetical protein F4819DRAFT_418012 [Hypoxylon fuscum]